MSSSLINFEEAANAALTLAQDPGATQRFSVRRFAGPAHYASQLDPLRIAHVTDLHVGRVTPIAAQFRAVEICNAAQPDLVVVTGDFVCHSQLYLDELTEVLGKIDAPVLCTLGNHDHWAGAHEVRWAIRRAGAEVLNNQNTILTIRHQQIQVVGLDDAYTGHADRHRATAGLRRDLPTIGLSHIAEEADALWHKHVPLIFSGHTHAGQIALGRLHELYLGRIAGHRYVHGLYGSRTGEHRTGAVYVGAGVGSAVVPVRMGERAQREVALFDLGHTPGSFAEHHGEQPPLAGRPPTSRTRERRASAVARKRARRIRRSRAA